MRFYVRNDQMSILLQDGMTETFAKVFRSLSMLRLKNIASILFITQTVKSFLNYVRDCRSCWK